MGRFLFQSIFYLSVISNNPLIVNFRSIFTIVRSWVWSKEKPWPITRDRRDSQSVKIC